MPGRLSARYREVKALVQSAMKADSVQKARPIEKAGAAPLISAEGLTKVYRRGNELVRALDGVSFDLQAGEFAAIVGPSGAGKTTLLHLLGCMDTPTSGELTLAGAVTRGLSDAALTRLRREQVGFVFQHFGLLPTLTVAENVALPTLFSRRKAAARCAELLEKVGLAHRRDHRPHELSGGEMQRAAIARALINAPQLLLADEPTGNLDSANGEAIIELFHQLNAEGLTVVVVTHNAALAEAARRQLCLQDGKLLSDSAL
ncbi:MAG TPA: ABC transporter ATP-binding protein [Chthonomonadaceae bacterium]|nr:ABC transporter ATP-binding protein [Chthonomonadaceae bacterium]